MEAVLQILRENKLKTTPLREAILMELMGVRKGLSKQDLNNSLQMDYDRSTLFRTLNTFEEKGILHKVMDEEGIAKYAFTQPNIAHSPKDHAHFYCTQCKSTFCLDHAVTLAKISLPNGFQKQGVEIQVRGICKRCLSQNKNNQPS